ncbi:hypothetical protein lerEdw1_020162 [Lerista edwardsae]|nr:hypothetical protein lerEdw1_020162 [Lerista edwardsae]
MYHQASSALSFMLGMLLAEDPTWKHPQGMLGHFTEFLNSEDPETQVEALIMAGSLERLSARCGIYRPPQQHQRHHLGEGSQEVASQSQQGVPGMAKRIGAVKRGAVGGTLCRKRACERNTAL